MKAPNGTELQGTHELIPGVALGTLDDGSEEIEYAGGTDVNWDGQYTVKVAGAEMFVDEDGTEWMQHHLIPDDAEPVSDETMENFIKEEKVGRLLDSLVETKSRAEIAGLSTLLTRHAVGDARATYEALKAISISLKERDLARVPS